MRPPPRSAVCLVAMCVGLLFVFCNSAWPQETAKAKPHIKELQQKRLAVLEKIHVSAKQLFSTARVEYEAVLAAQREFFAARLDYAETQQDLIKVCDEAIQDALDVQKVAQNIVKNGHGSALIELKAQAYLLETQITRELLETD